MREPSLFKVSEGSTLSKSFGGIGFRANLISVEESKAWLWFTTMAESEGVCMAFGVSDKIGSFKGVVVLGRGIKGGMDSIPWGGFEEVSSIIVDTDIIGFFCGGNFWL